MLNFFSDNEDFSGVTNIIEVKRKSLSGSGVVNQAIAETIVFSFLKNKTQSHITISPNILISPKEFRVIMYDTANDFLICSDTVKVFTKSTEDPTTDILDCSSIIILWMVLHYEHFLKQENSPATKIGSRDKKIFQAMFKDRALENYDLYKDELKFGVKSFRKEIVRDSFPTTESLAEGEDICNEE